MNFALKIAIHIPTGKYIHVDAAKNGNECNCKCVECGEILTAKQGDIRTSHFSHKVNINCTGGNPETLLHKLAKQIIYDNKEIIISKEEKLLYTDGIIEKSLLTIIPGIALNGKEIFPDVAITTNGQKVFFEIWVRHRKEEENKKAYKDNKLRCIEIDLSKTPLDATFEEIKYAVLFEYNNKTEIGWVNIQANTRKEISFEDVVKAILIGLGVVAVMFIISKILSSLFSRLKRAYSL